MPAAGAGPGSWGPRSQLCLSQILLSCYSVLRGQVMEAVSTPTLSPQPPSLCLSACLTETASALATALKDSILWES